ncbi:type II toxin-antitoxin system HicA family toxin [Bacillus nitratireducens]|uniref:type II toxin-antitoxin system HicA family toxin n=1 Tax=Bacillus nitratireducens TaxID=2026193 RepID=UPI000897F4B8|nr:type II toxin-antitoxin system HicA family toxin [Bacillus nitratireducens]SEA91594.1 HicA toxin of toxin-antitoxin [Bacillus nitratireducens]
MPYKKVMTVLKRNGWEVIRRRGSHIRLENRATKEKKTLAWCEGSFDKRKLSILTKSFGINFKSVR